MQYTLAQMNGYLSAIARQEADRDRTMLLLMRAAQSDQKGFKAVLDSLDRASR